MDPVADTPPKTRGGQWAYRGLGRGRGRGGIVRPVMGGYRRPAYSPDPLLRIVASQPPAPVPVPEPRAKPCEKQFKNIKTRVHIHPPHAFTGIHPRLKELFRGRAPWLPLPTSECSCDSCVEYEDFIKAVKLSLPDEMAQKKCIREIHAIAQDVMVNMLAGEDVDIEIGNDAEVKKMVVAVIACRIRRTA